MLEYLGGPFRHRIGMGITGVASFLALWIGAGSAHVVQVSPVAPGLPSLGDGLVSGVFVAGAACAAMVTWRRHAGPITGWIVATGALVAAQALAVTLLALWNKPLQGDFSPGVLLVAVVGLVCVAGPLLRLHRVDHVVDDGFVMGLGMGLVAAGHLLLQSPTAGPGSSLVQLVVGVVICTHVVATGFVLRQRVLPRPMSVLLALTTLVVGAGLVVHDTGLVNTTWDATASVARAAVGAVWLSLAWVSVRRALEEDRRRLATFQMLQASETRDQRERLHELRSTVAGLVTGSAMMDSPDVSPETRERLWGSVRRELDRMNRLLSQQDQRATDIDLDEALGMILDLQRLKGRHVEFHSNGDVVRARFDSLAEVLNILMDNAVTHGHTDSSLVEVERRDDDTVDIRVTDFGCGIPEDKRDEIFSWGGRASDAPGEGIGLHLAQRLMTEDGGSLRLADDQGVGSSFVISLPAARRSPEDDTSWGDHHAWRRSG